MAISLHAATSGVIGSGGGTENKTIPGTPAQNDVVVVLFGNDDDRGIEDIITSDYNQIGTDAGASPGGILAWKRMGASPDTVVELDQQSTKEGAYIIQVWRGVDTTTAMDATPVTATGGTGDPDPGSLTTVTANAVRVVAGALDDDTVKASLTAPSGYGDLTAEQGGTSGSGVTIMIASKLAASAGAENPAAFGTTGDDAWIAWHFALRPAAEAGITLAADAGSYAVTGTAATLKLGRRLVADAGSYAVTGQNASLVYGHPIAADAGSYAVAGTAASLLLGRKLAAEAGSYLITGQDSNLSVTAKRLAAEAGAYALTGVAVALKVGLEVAAEAGAYLVSGTAASLIKSWRLVADAGSYLVSGAAAGLNKGISLVGDAGAYAISGQNAVLKLGRRLVADAGSYAVTGQDATLAHIITRTILASTGAYAITGQAASLITSKRLAAGAGAYAIAGTDADLDITAAPVGTGSDWWIIEQRRRRGH